jgi:hypothetical protein
MQEVPPSSKRRNLFEGGLALSLLLLAIVSGYAILNPSTVRARVPHSAIPVTMAITSAGLPGSGSVDPGAASAPASPTPDTGLPATPPSVEEPAAPAPSARQTSPAPPAWPTQVTGRVLDDNRTPAAGVSVVLAGTEVRADGEGNFSIAGGAGTVTPLVVKMPGFDRAIVTPTSKPLEIVLKPRVVKAAYLTYFGFADKGIRGRVMELVAKTELNAVVIDIKGDRGWIPYRTEVPLALAAGAQGAVMLRDIEGMLAELRARGVYTIARIVVFKDNVLAQHRPDLAIIDTRTGKPWIDNEKLAWVDPFREEVWAYNIAIAKEAAAKGFDEVQFDYVRFPTDGKLAAARYARPNTRETRLPTIAAFLERARREVGATGVFLGTDIFGYTAFNENDTDIGQRIEELAPHVDYLCPMVYPSGYHVGIPGYRNPVANPYAIVHESVKLTRKRSVHATVRVRPWLQDFKDYAFDRRIFGVPEIRAQIRGAEEAGAAGWMLWNPRNDYTGAALRPKGPLAAR